MGRLKDLCCQHLTDDANVKDISSSISKLTDHVLKKLDATGLIDVLKDTSNQSTTMKELTDTMKYFPKQDRTTAQAQIPSLALQEESTQIILEQESHKIKQAIIDNWNTNLTKRRTEFWQMLRQKHTSKTYEAWKNSAPMNVPRKFQMKAIEGEPLTQTQRREKQVLYNVQTDIEFLEVRIRSHEEKCHTIDEAMEELICQKAIGKRRELVKKHWKG